MKNKIKCIAFSFLFLGTLIKSQTILPFKYFDHKIFVEIEIDKEKYNFLFDTGAFTLVSNTLETKINYKKTNILFDSKDANLISKKLNVYQLKQISIAGKNLNKINFSFADIDWMSKRACMKVDGVFGANAMEGAKWKLDFQRKIIIIDDVKNENSGKNLIKIPFTKQDFTSVMQVQGLVKNEKVQFYFDSGSGMDITIDDEVYKKVKDAKYIESIGYTSQSLNLNKQGNRFIDAMPLKIENTDFGKQLINTEEQTLNLIGTRFMEQFIVNLNFVDNIIEFEPVVKGNVNANFNSFGFSTAPINNQLKVVNLYKLDKTKNINLFDTIIKVDELSTEKMTETIYCSILDKFLNNTTITIEKSTGEKIEIEKSNIIQDL